MSIKALLTSDGMEEMYAPPTLKERCLYKCLTNKDILTKEVEVNLATNGNERLPWEKFRLKEPIQRELVEALLDAADEYLFMLTPKYEAILAAIRMSQPEHLVKVHVSNTDTLKDRQLELFISGGNVKSLDIHGCNSLRKGSLDAINKFGRKLEYLRIGDSCQVLPTHLPFGKKSAILRTPNLKTFIVSEILYYLLHMKMTDYWRLLLHDFISNLEDLQISGSQRFQTLEFLEPAATKLSSLTFTNCMIAKSANAWASLFKLDKLRSLDLVGSSIEEAFVGENVVQRLLTAMPNLTHLAVDSGLGKNIYVDSSIRGQGSNPKRLELLVVMDNDAAVVGKAKLLASEVACFGTLEEELRILEYFSNRLNSAWKDLTLDRLLESLSLVTAPWKAVAVISSLMKTFKNNGVSVVRHKLFFKTLKQLLTSEVSGKLGEVLVDQCFGAIVAFMSYYYGAKDLTATDEESRMISDTIDIMTILDSELRFDHYVTVVPMVMQMAGKVMKDDVLRHVGMEDFKILLKRITQLLEKALDRFPGETNALWGISSVLVIIKELKNVMLFSYEGDRIELLEIFSSLIGSLQKLCLNSGAGRAVFYSVGRLEIIMDLLKEIMDGRLGFAERDSFALLEILRSILQDTELELDLSKFWMIASGLEKLLLSVHSQWEIQNYVNSDSEATHYSHLHLQSMTSLLNFLESDPRYDYKACAPVKEIMMKFK